jgi:RND family efflux transporter MFP subunit
LGGLAVGAYKYRDSPQSSRAIAKSIGSEAKAVDHSTEHSTHSASASPENAPNGERKILYWVDPMNPSNKSDKPGKAPCGMDLVPVYADEEAAGEEPLPAGAVQIGPQKQQLIGVEYGEAAEEALSRSIRTVGGVTYDETKISHVHTRIEGWIEKVFVDFTGELVKKGQPLLSIYSPELVSAQQELLIAKKSKDILGNSPFKEVGAGSLSLYDSSRQRLRLWNVSDAQIKQIEKRGAPITSLTLSSEINGFVLTRNAFTGLRVTPETELYTVADLSTVWVIADVYEYEAPMIKIGQAATMTLPYFPGKMFKGKVTYIYPGLDKTTRTLKVRLEFPNRDFQLKPDMYSNVELHVDYGVQLAVPAEAVLDSGAEQIVFVALDNGYFEPRKVTLGQKVGNRFIIADGLKKGERIVTSGNFLIDSESRLKSAVGGMAGMGHAGHGGEAPQADTGKNSGERQLPSDAQSDHSQHGQKPAEEGVDHSQHIQKPAGNDHSGHTAPAPRQPSVEKPTDHSGHGM